MNTEQKKISTERLGPNAVQMLEQVHQDALWILENLGVGCKQMDLQNAFKQHEDTGNAIIYENRIYLTSDLVAECLEKTPGLDDFFVPRNSFFIGGTAPYIYNDAAGEGGVMPTEDHAERIARIAESHPMVAGMGRGIKLKDEARQIEIMTENCHKPMYFAVTTDSALEKAKEAHHNGSRVMIVFCLTRPPLEVNENFSEDYVKVVRAGLPVFISAMPMGGISAPYCYNGTLAMTHAEVLFGVCAAQLLNPGHVCVHAGFPTIADPLLDYNPNYGLISHQMLNLLMTHLNLMLDLPTCQSAGTTHEEHLTEKAYQDGRNGQALCKKYGFHMIRHPFSFLRYLIDFSIEKLEKSLETVESVKADDAPDFVMPEYDERGMESIKNIGLGFYKDDPLTTANLGKIFQV